MNANHPFDVLQDLERRGLKGSKELLALDKVQDEWAGVGFRLGGAKLVTSMDDVKEILAFPEYTQVPGVKPWVVGVANVRGSLLPIIDMKGYLFGGEIKKRRDRRVIVIEYKDFNTGLIVDEVFGMRHFRERDEVTESPKLHHSVDAYVKRVYKQGEEFWSVFDFSEMMEDERFAHVSL